MPEPELDGQVDDLADGNESKVGGREQDWSQARAY